MHAALMILVLVMLACVGCTDRLAIKSSPPGAAVTVDGKSLGDTPTELAVGRYERWPEQISIEEPGYEPYVAPIRTQSEIGRWLVGFVFWGPFGILFQPLSAFDYSRGCYQNWATCELYVSLVPETNAAPASAPAPPPSVDAP